MKGHFDGAGGVEGDFKGLTADEKAAAELGHVHPGDGDTVWFGEDADGSGRAGGVEVGEDRRDPGWAGDEAAEGPGGESVVGGPKGDVAVGMDERGGVGGAIEGEVEGEGDGAVVVVAEITEWGGGGGARFGAAVFEDGEAVAAGFRGEAEGEAIQVEAVRSGDDALSAVHDGYAADIFGAAAGFGRSEATAGDSGFLGSFVQVSSLEMAQPGGAAEFLRRPGRRRRSEKEE